MKLEILPNMKQKIEEDLNNLISGTDIEKIEWTVKSDVGERKIIVEIMPNFKDVADPTKFGELGTKGFDILPEEVKYVRPVKDEIEYPNLS